VEIKSAVCPSPGLMEEHVDHPPYLDVPEEHRDIDPLE